MQQVNLLTEDLKPHVEPLTLGQLAVGWSAVAGLLLLVSAWQGLEPTSAGEPYHTAGGLFWGPVK